MAFTHRAFVIRALPLTHKNVFTGKSTPLKTAVLVPVRSRVKRVEGPENLNREEGNIPERLDDTHEDASSSTKTIKTVLKGKVTALRKSTSSIWHPQFLNNFEFINKRKDEFFCPICKDVLDIPIKTVCSHYSCADCLFQVIEFADGPPSCSMCNVHLTYELDIRCAQGFLSNSFVNWICIAKDVTRSYSTKIDTFSEGRCWAVLVSLEQTEKVKVVNKLHFI